MDSQFNKLDILNDFIDFALKNKKRRTVEEVIEKLEEMSKKFEKL